ncbi:hypothetical protein [Burkholderia territorii]|uniref:hypothetical protein n=1 Tax=Burkholderia territorii TaxID=1503055 RepID=UPI0009BD81CB|nr:hypothetical protein [Burkholderia territorii]
MRYISLVVATAALSACAAQPSANVQPVGDSQQSVRTVAQCVAQKWANRSQQRVVLQDVLANDRAIDVYAPGSRPPDGAAAIVRPLSASGKSAWVGLRAGTTGNSDSVDDIKACL